MEGAELPGAGPSAVPSSLLEERDYRGCGFTGRGRGLEHQGAGLRGGGVTREAGLDSGGVAVRGVALQRGRGLDSTQGGVASWGRGRRWGVTSEGKAWLQGAWPYREGVASWGRGHKGGRGVGWGVASRGRGFKGAWLHGGGGVSGHAPSRPDPHLGSTDPIELVPAPWIWGEPPWPWI